MKMSVNWVMKVIENKRPFVCRINGCNKRFTRSDHLIRHKLVIHSNERPFKCEDCGKAFKANDYLKRHKLIHSNDHKYNIHLNKRRFICDYIGCQKRFKQKSTLIRHKLIHSNVKPFKCDVKDCH